MKSSFVIYFSSPVIYANAQIFHYLETDLRMNEPLPPNENISVLLTREVSKRISVWMIINYVDTLLHWALENK